MPTASQIADIEIEPVIVDYLSRPCAGEHDNRSLRETVALHFGTFNIQTRRIARIAWAMSQKGMIAVREYPGDYGITKVRYSSVSR